MMRLSISVLLPLTASLPGCKSTQSQGNNVQATAAYSNDPAEKAKGAMTFEQARELAFSDSQVNDGSSDYVSVSMIGLTSGFQYSVDSCTFGSGASYDYVDVRFTENSTGRQEILQFNQKDETTGVLVCDRDTPVLENMADVQAAGGGCSLEGDAEYCSVQSMGVMMIGTAPTVPPPGEPTGPTDSQPEPIRQYIYLPVIQR